MTDRPEITAENVSFYTMKYLDVWLPSTEIEKLLPINYQSVHLWARRGLVRSEPIPKAERVHRGPTTRYCVSDCVVARLTVKRSKPFRMKTIDGVRHGCCTKCDQWKPAEGDDDQFYFDRRNGGKYPTCRTCHNHRPMSTKQKQDARRRQRRIYEENKKNAERARTWRGRETVDSQAVVDLLNERFPNQTAVEICRRARVHEDLVRRIAKNAAEGKPTKIGPVDDLLTGLDLTIDFNRIVSESSVEAPRWHHTFPYCQKCQSVKRPHRLRGLCSSCYANRNNPDYIPAPDNRWSLKYPRCILCETTEIPHGAYGECRSCYGKRRRKGKR